MATKSSQVVVITGASAGVGRAAARRFARDGARIGLIARGPEALEATRREVEALGGRALVLPADVADASAVDGAAERAERELGPIEVWINNAMTSVFSPLREITPEEFERVTQVTYLGQVWGAMAALKRMRPRRRGAIVFVGSALAYRGIPLQSAYCGAKHATQGFFESLRAELLHERSGVRVCMVQLPAMNTPQFRMVRSKLPNKAQPVPPIFQPEVAADAIHFAVHSRRREVYVGGSTVLTIAGNKLVPAAGDRYLARYGYRSQQTPDPEDAGRADNLWEPLEGDHGMHGEFGDRAHERSLQLWATKHRSLLALAALAGLAAGGSALFRSRR